MAQDERGELQRYCDRQCKAADHVGSSETAE